MSGSTNLANSIRDDADYISNVSPDRFREAYSGEKISKIKMVGVLIVRVMKLDKFIQDKRKAEKMANATVNRLHSMDMRDTDERVARERAIEESRRRERDRRDKESHDAILREREEEKSRGIAAMERNDYERRRGKESLLLDQQKSLNDRLTAIDNIKSNELISRNTEVYGDDNVDVYEIPESYPIAMLVHNIGFRMNTGKSAERTKSVNLLEDPSLWAASSTSNSREYKSNNISTSYINTRKSMTMDDSATYYNSDSDLIYGFDHIDDSHPVLEMKNDGTTSSKMDDYRADAVVKSVDYLESTKSKRGYNEIVLKRYDNEGRPLAPQYIVSYKETPSETDLKHAAYWGVPVLHIKRSNSSNNTSH